MEKTFTYYDMEADSGSAVKATCISCSYVTVSSNFKVIEEGTFNSRLRKSRAFEVDAMLAHNIPLSKISFEDGSEELSNGQLVDKLEAKFIELANAYEIALSGRMGPVLIDVPMDVQQAEAGTSMGSDATLTQDCTSRLVHRCHQGLPLYDI